MRSTVTINSSNKAEVDLRNSLTTLTRKQVYVGIPATTSQERQAQVNKILSRRKKTKAIKQQDLNNAELVYIHTHGSPLRGIPARPIIEAAIEEPENSELIANELKLAADAALAGKTSEVDRQLKLSGVQAQNLVRAWFTNPKNHWAPNAPSTIRRKGSSKPLIDTGALRAAITYVVSEE